MSDAMERLKQEAEEAKSLSHHRVTDITEKFKLASDRLKPGELIKDEWFTLFESVGALEIMDPKMDSGYVPEGDSFEADFDPATPLTLPQVIGVMDQLLCLEITWHTGYPLSQTVFTSLHIDRILDPQQSKMPTLYSTKGGDGPKDLTEEAKLGHELLTVYCIAVARCCAQTIELVQSQTYYEEEDFVTHLFGRDLLPHITIEEAQGLIINVSARLAQSKAGHQALRDALKRRLEFRRLLMASFGESGANADTWKALSEVLGKMKKSHSLAKPLPKAFSDKVQRKLATSTPPRPMLSTSWDEACNKWSNMCDDVVAIFRLTDPSIAVDPGCLLRAVWVLSYRKDLFTLPRAILQDILFSNGTVRGANSHNSMLLRDIRDLALAGDSVAHESSYDIEVTTDPRHISIRLITSFIDKAIEEYLNIFRMICQNRCRIRRNFTQAMPILDAMELEATKVDAELAEYAPSLSPMMNNLKSVEPLTRWSRFQKLRMMTWTVQLGFETEIYEPSELHRMYEYLARLSQQQMVLLQSLLNANFYRQRYLQGDREALAECHNGEGYLESLLSCANVTMLLAESLKTLFSHLVATEAVKKPAQKFATEQLLYEARMKPYLAAYTTWMPPAEDLMAPPTAITDWGSTGREINKKLREAQSLIKRLKVPNAPQGRYIGTESEWIEELDDLKAVSQSISALMTRLERSPQGLECKIERRHAAWWPLPVLDEKK